MKRQKKPRHCDFLTHVGNVPGIGEKSVYALQQAGITTIGDLLQYFPRRYIDRSVLTPIAELGAHADACCCVVGTITRTRVQRGRRSRFRIWLQDATGTCEAMWFHHIQGMRSQLRKGKKIALTGTVSARYGVCMVHPLVEPLAGDQDRPAVAYLPVYPMTGAMKEARMSQKRLFDAIAWCLRHVEQYPQMLPRQLEAAHGFVSRRHCIRQLHMPDDPAALGPCIERLKYEELYALARELHFSRRRFAGNGRALAPGDMTARFERHCPFPLADEQKETIALLQREAAGPQRMHRLLHGDVGAGKTVVAFCAALPALDNGFQVAWMAPTEVLAAQTHAVISQWAQPLGLEVCLYTGRSAGAQRQRIAAALSAGQRLLVVGTHALAGDSLCFGRLGMCVIDEQHRFGVAQRIRLQHKDPRADFLLLSATPIPQTLCHTMYGDLKTVALHTGAWARRRHVTTHMVPAHKRRDMQAFVAEALAHGDSRAFYVVPRIEADDDGETNGLRDIETVQKDLAGGPCKRIPMAVLHGRSGPEAQQEAVRGFAEGTVRFLLATTVIEVGVDVPDADIMVVENAQRFGLAQLHQLRGRVCRGTGRGYCFLVYDSDIGDAARQRLKYFCTDNDGFRIAEKDLQMRGPGELTGVRQSGWLALRFADMLRDAAAFKKIQAYIDTHIGE